MARLKHDTQGFLVGDPTDLSSADARTQGAILAEVRAIRQHLVGAASRSPSTKAPGRVADNDAVLTPTKRSAATREVAQPMARGDSAATTARSSADQKAVAAVARRAIAPAIPKQRDGRGRFVPNGGKDGGSDGDSDQPGAPGSGDREASGLLARLSRAALNSGAGMEEADPAVKAFNEVAQPMARGYELLTGGSEDKKQTGMLRRIFGTLNVLRSDESSFNKAANKSLKSIEMKPDGEGAESGGLFGGIGALVKMLPGVGLLSAGLAKTSGLLSSLGGMLTKIPGVGKAVGAGKGVLSTVSGGAAGAGALGGGVKALGKGMLKKVPIIGALLGGALAWGESSAADNDETLSLDQKRAKKGSAWGSAAGGVIGATFGSLLGPLGTIVGGVVGDWLGGQFGEMIGGNWTAMTEGISSTWASCTSFFSSTWDSTLSGATAAFDSVKTTWGDAVGKVSSMFSSAYDYLKGIPVIGPAIEAAGDAAKKAAEVATNTVAAVKDKAVEVAVATKDKAVAAGTAVKDAAVTGADYVANNTMVGRAAKSAGSWVLGQTSKLFESGKGGAGTVSSGKGDFGGASYGTYQLSSKQGETQNFLKKSGYGSQFEGMQPGSKEFNDKWKEVAKSDPAFGDAQHDYIKSTKFDPQMAKLKKAGIDLSGRGAAVNDAVWSTSVQFGGETDLIKKALAGKDSSKMADAEIVSAIQDYKIANNDKLFKSSSDSVRAGTAKRAEAEKSKLVALAAQDIPGATSPAMPTAMANAGAPAAPSLPSMPSVAEAPPVIDPMASTGGKPVVAVANTPDVGQDMRDRRIAHVVTGGLS